MLTDSISVSIDPALVEFCFGLMVLPCVVLQGLKGSPVSFHDIIFLFHASVTYKGLGEAS
jgi:hypothetical protein